MHSSMLFTYIDGTIYLALSYSFVYSSNECICVVAMINFRFLCNSVE